MDVSPQFSDRLLMARRRANLEQDELAQRVGLTRHVIGRLERGQTEQINIGALRRLARVLDVTIDWLCAMDVEESPEVNPCDSIMSAPCL